MRQPLVAGNWKMNGTLEKARVLVKEIADGRAASNGHSEAVVCPPFVYLAAVAEVMRGTRLKLGVQNVSEHEAGAYTGEIGAEMLADFDCRYAIVGHSERRALYAEGDAMVAAKFQRVLRTGVTPILCVGETLEEREAGETEAVIARQIDAVIEHVDAANLSRGVVAYEPVWAIGTGRTASPEQANEVHAFIRKRVSKQDSEGAAGMRILYGGSVKSSNCEAIFQMPDIDGGLIGGASLKAGEFLDICQAAG
jgi:triosephosphate isomerase